MQRTAFSLFLGCAGVLLCAGCASAQRPGGAEPVPTVAQPAPDPANPRGYTGFNIAFRMTMGAGAAGAEPPVIGEVVPGSPAQKAGLAPGDVILEVDGRDAREEGALRVRPGVRYTYRIRRGDQEREVALVADVHPADRGGGHP